MNKNTENIENLGTQNLVNTRSKIISLISIKNSDNFATKILKKIILLGLYIPKKIVHNRRKKSLKSFYSIHCKEVESLLNLVSDDLSRDVINTQINFIINYDYTNQNGFLIKNNLMEKHKSLFDEDHYFSKDIIKLSTEEGFVNCGSHIGDTVEDFVKRTNGKFKHIFAFEPSKINFIELLATVKKLEIDPTTITCYQKGVYSENSTCNFNINEEDGGGSSITKNGGEIIEIVKLDTFLSENEKNTITFINMDIEGAEMDALVGMHEIIKKNKPKLAISVYHDPEHFWTIPFFIKSLNPEYKIYFRQHSISKSETVCYAI
ncbi:MAG: FkbM family methyltransferase [bacterium]